MTSSKTSPSTIIACFPLGMYETNCYVLRRATSGNEPDHPEPCWVIDVGYDPDPLIAYIKEHRLEPKAVVLTHAHCDHIAGLDQFRSLFPGVEVMLHKDEAAFPQDPTLNLSAFSGDPRTVAPADRTLEGNETLEMAGATWTLSHTPGHSPGGITLYSEQEGVALVGDTLFAGSIGRHDFPTSKYPDLERSIREKLYTLPPETRVLPGHGPATTIGQEKATNPFVRA
jgi:hydroxyacylglutathione hydrolase